MASELAELLKAGGETTRLRILNLLRKGSICVCHLQTVLGLPQPTVSRHLAALRHAGLVLDFRQGPRVLYSLAPAKSSRVEAFYEFLEKACLEEDVLQQDAAALQDALQRGACVVVERTHAPGGGRLRETANS